MRNHLVIATLAAGLSLSGFGAVGHASAAAGPQADCVATTVQTVFHHPRGLDVSYIAHEVNAVGSSIGAYVGPDARSNDCTTIGTLPPGAP